MTLTEQAKILDEKIKADREDREAAKISAL